MSDPALPGKDELIRALNLTPHVEGGYFRRTYASPYHTEVTSGPAHDLGSTRTAPLTRLCMSSIFYLLTDDSPIGHLHRNRSDIVHYYQGGGPLRYTLIHPDGHVEYRIMGMSVTQGHLLQMTVPGGVWKASELLTGPWGLVSEAVCPGFDMDDMELADLATLQGLRPNDWQTWQGLIRQV